MPRNKEPRERLSPTLERITLEPGGPHTHCLIFTGTLEVCCPRCQKPAAITGYGLSMTLACGCTWHPPRHERKRDREAWLSYWREG